MMVSAAARPCNAAGELARGREEQGSPLLLDVEERRLEDDCTTEIAMKAAERATKFILRGLLILLGVYLFNSMRKYAVSYTAGDTGFSTFAVMVVAVPIAEIFCILGQLVGPIGSSSSAPCRACGYASATTRSNSSNEVDLEKGFMTTPQPAGVVAKADMADADKVVMEMTVRIVKCIIKGMFALPWVYLVDLMRRYVATSDLEELFFTLTPLVILAASVTVFFCYWVEKLGECVHPPEPELINEDE
ncbi:hypothetical protein U9M48_009747 [Paspalum notatum var. saurae]|uniref:Uncharacterized protein n=1 Tax=Paspalum notatum var. saurae TaxID=547442 RepID=A0AAQ3SS07_PASNO